MTWKPTHDALLNFINGNYTLTARIIDTAGKVTVTAGVPVTIQN